MKKGFKKLLLIPLFSVLLFGLVACEDQVPSTPVFHGVEDCTIQKGSTFKPLEGVTITDKEDGEISVSTVSVNARSLNVNAEGTYEVKYTVYDSDGNKTEVIRKVTVVYSDVKAPEFYGVAAKAIVVGDETFTPLKDVSAIDIVDGDLTSAIDVKGSVDVWTPGVYNLEYSVSDKSGNKSTITRQINVEFGNLSFEDEAHDLSFNNTTSTISGGKILENLEPFGLLKLELVLSSGYEKELFVSIDGAIGNTETVKVKDEKHYDFYFRFDEPLENKTITLSQKVTVVSAKYSFSVSNDKTAPVISGVSENGYVAPISQMTIEEIREMILKNVTALDEVEGDLTSIIDVDLKDVIPTAAGDFDITISCSDSSGNKEVIKTTLTIAKVYNTNAISDPEFNGTAPEFKISQNGGGTTSAEVKDGCYVFTIDKVNLDSGYGSANSPYLSGVTTKKIQPGSFYMLKFDVKADVARNMNIRCGLELWSSPWIENFTPVQKYHIDTEWTTITYIFYCGKATSDDGSNNVKCELQLGAVDWNETANVVYFDNFQFYQLSNEVEKPVVEFNKGIVTTFGKGESLPDFTKYITAKDYNGNDITITSSMIDQSNFDINTEGEYVIKFNVVDAESNLNKQELKVKVISEKDTTAPVITIPAAVKTTIAGYLPVKDSISLKDLIEQFIGSVTIVDNVDGNITPTIDMIDFGGFNYLKSNVGTFKLKVVYTDTSGNIGESEEITITCEDTTAPAFIGLHDQTVYVGDEFNPLDGVVGYDQVDGTIKILSTNISGLDAFLSCGTVLDAVGEYQVTYEVTDNSGNKATAIQKITVKAAADKKGINESKSIDLLSQKKSAAGGDVQSAYDNDGVLTITYPGKYMGWASGVQLKYYNINLAPAKKYVLQLEIKASTAREIVIYFVDGAGNKMPGFNTEEGQGKLKVGLTEDTYLFEYEFTCGLDSVDNCTFELDFDYESFIVNSAIPNEITISKLTLARLAN